MSISYVEDFYVVDSDRLTCYSPIDMSIAATSSPSSFVDFSNDPPSSDPSESTLSELDRFSNMITLDSFIPILENLPGFYLDQNSYYMIRGSLTEADWARLRDYTRTVSKFIVTDNNSKAQISPAAFIRLARLLHPDTPLLPYLSDLVIVDADTSISYLDLLLTPSLKSLKASCIPDAQQLTFSYFLTAIEKEVPLLQTLILGPGRFISSSLQTISQFNSLHHLELKHEGSELPFAFFDNVGSLAMLNTLILDARHVSGTVTGVEPTFIPSPSDNSDATDDNRDEHGAADGRQSKTFNQLAELHVTGWLPLLEDLIHRITSTKLEDVSFTFIRLSFAELKVSLAKEKAEEIRRREEAEKKMREQEKLLKDEMERKRIDEERQWREEMEMKMKEQEKLWEDDKKMEQELDQKKREEEQSFIAFNFPSQSKVSALPSYSSPFSFGVPYSSCESPAEESTKKKKHPAKKQEVTKGQEIGVRERLLKEQERQANLSFDAHTVSFTEILRELCCRWKTSLKSLSVCQLKGSFQIFLKPPTLPEDVFRTMLLLPAIQNLEVKGWILDSVEGVLSAVEPIPNLNCLLLPSESGRSNSGISLPTLRHVAKTCPKLESFQCYIMIDPHSPIPEYSIPTNAGLSHGLRTLSVGSSSSSFPGPLPVDQKAGYLIARHLYLLFPKLETIKTSSEEHDAELWASVDEFVKIFQTARMDDLNRQ